MPPVAALVGDSESDSDGRHCTPAVQPLSPGDSEAQPGLSTISDSAHSVIMIVARRAVEEQGCDFELRT